MINLDGVASSLPADKVDRLTGVGIMQGSGHNEATVEHGVYKVALQNNIAHIATIYGAPIGIKIGANVFGLGVVGFDFEFF